MTLAEDIAVLEALKKEMFCCISRDRMTLGRRQRDALAVAIAIMQRMDGKRKKSAGATVGQLDDTESDAEYFARETP